VAAAAARKGTANLFPGCEPLAGRRWVEVTERRTAVDWARPIEALVDVRCPEAEWLVLVVANLNTHSPASLYNAFPPAEARRLADRLEIHDTPKHGSWLNSAGIELSVLSRQPLDRRIPDIATLQAEVKAWQERRNAAGSTIDWRSTTADARINLKRPYPKDSGVTEHSSTIRSELRVWALTRAAPAPAGRSEAIP
jgi:hypothetical protein